MSAATVKLWDPVVRLFHLSVAAAFFANYFFNEQGAFWHRWIATTPLPGCWSACCGASSVRAARAGAISGRAAPASRPI